MIILLKYLKKEGCMGKKSVLDDFEISYIEVNIDPNIDL